MTGLGGSKPASLGVGAAEADCRATSPGNHHHRHAALAHGLANSDLQRARHLIGARDKLAIVAALFEQHFRVGFLKVAGADLGRGNLRGNRQHRDTRAMAIEKAVYEVKIAWSAAAGADRELAGQVRFGARREGSHLLVAHVNPLDFRLPANGVREAVEAVANDSVYSLNALPPRESAAN